MQKEQILDALFWIFLFIGIGMLLWKIFGHSPGELEITVPILSALILKLWSTSDKLFEKISGLSDRLSKLEIWIDRIER